ncbi:MAG: RhuM family protein [Candidatus Paceibacterota bacterium]
MDETIWLPQALMDERFTNSVARNFRTTAGNEKSYNVVHYNLEAVLAVGFRVKSSRGTQYRRWANTQIRELIIDRMLAFNEQPVLEGAGSVGCEQMKVIAEARYAEFDAKRRVAEAGEADAEHLKAIEELEKELKRTGGTV